MKYLFLTLALLIAVPDLSAASDGPRRKRSTYGASKKKHKFTSCRKAKRILNRRHR